MGSMASNGSVHTETYIGNLYYIVQHDIYDAAANALYGYNVRVCLHLTSVSKLQSCLRFAFYKLLTFINKHSKKVTPKNGL